MKTELLRKIGLTNREIDVYMKLLQKGESSANEIAKDLSVSRTHIYESLHSLITKGLVSHIVKNFKKFYSATAPSKINDYLDERKNEIESQKKQAKELITQLTSIEKVKEKGAKVEIYEGKEGIKTIAMDTIKTKNSEILMLNVLKAFKDTVEYFAEHYFKEKIKRKIKSKVIFAEKFEFLDPTAEKRIIEKEEVSPATTLIYRDKVAIILWLEKPLGIVIENKDAAKEYKSYFEVLWKQAEKVDGKKRKI